MESIRQFCLTNDLKYSHNVFVANFIKKCSSPEIDASWTHFFHFYFINMEMHSCSCNLYKKKIVIQELVH